MSCGVGPRHDSDLELLWLWRRLEATAPIGPLAWEHLYAVGAALKRTKDTHTQNYFNFFIKVQSIYNVVPVSAYSKVTQCVYMCVYVCVCVHTHSLSYIIFPHGLYQETGYSSLCYTVGP